MIARASAAALLLALVGAAPADPLAGRTAGKAVNCIDLDRVQGPDFTGDGAILYRQNGGRLWRTEPVGHCTRTRPGDGLIVEVQGRRLCRNDRFRVRSNGYLSAAQCRFGEFVPFDRGPSPLSSPPRR